MCAENELDKKTSPVDEPEKVASSSLPGHVENRAPEQQTLTVQQALDVAVQHQKADRLPQAESIYQQILQAFPNQPVALNLLGVIAYQVGKFDQSVELITKAIDIKPDFAEAHSNLGNVLKELGRLEPFQ